MCQRKGHIRRLGHVQVTLGPLSALWTLIACLAVLPTCHRGASWVSVGDAVRHQHLSLRILEHPQPPAGHLLIPLPLQICPLYFPLHTFLCSLVGNYGNKENWKSWRCSTVYNTRTWKQPRCPSADEWIRKLWHIYTMEYYSAIKKNTFESVLMRWMKLEPIIQSEVSQKEKHQYSILMHIYGI